ncbi:HupE/UreJ family protein [Phaeobacter marinintestinus]|uniref:HupE/UreJ family protein n=1 Tax=Falsiphaeobacter marinintestinus TaxID=1492905 RepID=UPI0011B7750D|nr:HupE/UreJ family protein [Phaeobacter marinintestinus]
MTRIVALLLICLAAPAWAHHPLAGQPMEIFAHGVLSGIGHPVLGFDHLFFILAVGVLARVAGMPLRGPLAYVATMLLGCALIYSGWKIPLTELMIALSLLLVGFVLACGKPIAPWTTLTLFAGYGLFHGAAFGASIAGQEGGISTSVLAGYLIGLGAIQYVMALGAGIVADRILNHRADDLPVRLAGAMVAGVGLFLCLEAVEGPILDWLAS